MGVIPHVIVTVSSPSLVLIECTLHTAITLMNSVGTAESHVNSNGTIMRETLLFQYSYHVSECSAQLGLKIVTTPVYISSRRASCGDI